MNTEPTPNDELSGRVLGIIRVYRMGATLDTRQLSSRRPAPEPVPEGVAVPAQGTVVDGVYHPADTPS